MMTSFQVYLSGSVSSQFLTALLMAAPLSTGKEGIEIIIKVKMIACHMNMHDIWRREYILEFVHRMSH
jgi:5-enolpyruvylshikimate-3-phosphate synthase